MNEEMMTTGFTGGDTATGPTAGYDPVMKMRAKLKDLKGLVAPGNKLSTSNKKKVKKEDYQYEAKVDKKLPCLLYTSPSPRDGLLSRMPSSA